MVHFVVWVIEQRGQREQEDLVPYAQRVVRVMGAAVLSYQQDCKSRLRAPAPEVPRRFPH
ncbi:hypothetical protein EYF80_030934 [Liparis tanakae]|uniref:Uncharacterized protein n=1 Tax=Liparis tanakae TaxID=230148 RepID=A0A4Z2GZV1_9TELE|nr:hypothetical protein EYF80_030934 [Liparis tanakae]